MNDIAKILKSWGMGNAAVTSMEQRSESTSAICRIPLNPFTPNINTVLSSYLPKENEKMKSVIQLYAPIIPSKK